jgi:predicted O-methyltransferase YrrM
MGHAQSEKDSNLGFGWLYYALVRILRPKNIFVIGSYRGFVPIMMAKGLNDNLGAEKVYFLDPSLADDFWANPELTKKYFADLGLPNIEHLNFTTQDFINTELYEELDNIGIAMIDGYHSAEQARIDYLALLPKLSKNAIVLFHDSTKIRQSDFYGKDKVYQHSVPLFIDKLKQTPGLEVFTLDIASGLTLVQGAPKSLEFINQDIHEALNT